MPYLLTVDVNAQAANIVNIQMCKIMIVQRARMYVPVPKGTYPYRAVRARVIPVRARVIPVRARYASGMPHWNKNALVTTNVYVTTNFSRVVLIYLLHRRRRKKNRPFSGMDNPKSRLIHNLI